MVWILVFGRIGWLPNGPLCDRFPQLFSITLEKDIKVGEVWRGGGGVTRWSFQCGSRSFCKSLERA